MIFIFVIAYISQLLGDGSPCGRNRGVQNAATICFVNARRKTTVNFRIIFWLDENMLRANVWEMNSILRCSTSLNQIHLSQFNLHDTHSRTSISTLTVSELILNLEYWPPQCALMAPRVPQYNLLNWNHNWHDGWPFVILFWTLFHLIHTPRIATNLFSLTLRMSKPYKEGAPLLTRTALNCI